MSAGACDYVVKPYDPDVLASKVQRTLELHEEREKLKQKASSASQLVQTVLSETASLGSLVNFFRSSFHAANLEELCQVCVEALQALGCSGVVFCQLHHQRECLDTNELPTMLEIELLERIHGGGEPFVEKDESLFVLGHHLTLLIRHAPKEAEKQGSLKDTLKILEDLLGIVMKATQQSVEHFEAGIELDDEIKEIVAYLSEAAQQVAH